MEQKRPTFVKSLLMGITGLGITAAIYTASNWPAHEQKVENIEQTCQQIYTQMVENETYTYLDYKAKCLPNISQIEEDITKLEKEFNINWQKNLIAEYKSSKNNNISPFEGDFNKLQELSKLSWLAFNGSEEQNKKDAIDRFRLIDNLFISSLSELTKIKNNSEHTQDTNTEIAQFERKKEINEYTFNESYKSFEYFRALLILKIERWRCLNPTDALNTKLEFENLKTNLDSMNFNLLSQK